MKNINRIAVAAILGLGLRGLAIAQVHHGMPGHETNPASMVKHLSEAYPKIRTFDANKDGKLDATEKEALAKTIANGTLELPAHIPPHGEKPTAEAMVNHITQVYSIIFSTYDANHDGELDATEQGAIKSAIEAGDFPPHESHL